MLPFDRLTLNKIASESETCTHVVRGFNDKWQMLENRMKRVERLAQKLSFSSFLFGAIMVLFVNFMVGNKHFSYFVGMLLLFAAYALFN